MTADLSEVLRGLAEFTWDSAAALEFASSLGDASGASVDHDAGAGESWIQVLTADELLAVVHVHRPFVMVQPGVVVPQRERSPVVLLSARLHDPSFRADPQAIVAAFGSGGDSVAVAGDFSPADLWFATV